VIGPAWRLLVALHFVCPLIFFTNLTRNPYFTQIALLNIGVLVAFAVIFGSQFYRRELEIPRTPLLIPFVVFIGVCSLSWLYSYFFHAAFYRDSIKSEGLRVMLFTLVNCFIPFILATMTARDCPDDPQIPVGKWAIFSVVWMLLWQFYPQLKQPTVQSIAILLCGQSNIIPKAKAQTIP